MPDSKWQGPLGPQRRQPAADLVERKVHAILAELRQVTGKVATLETALVALRLPWWRRLWAWFTRRKS